MIIVYGRCCYEYFRWILKHRPLVDKAPSAFIASTPVNFGIFWAKDLVFKSRNRMEIKKHLFAWSNKRISMKKRIRLSTELTRWNGEISQTNCNILYIFTSLLRWFPRTGGRKWQHAESLAARQIYWAASGVSTCVSSSMGASFNFPREDKTARSSPTIVSLCISESMDFSAWTEWKDHLSKIWRGEGVKNERRGLK